MSLMNLVTSWHSYLSGSPIVRSRMESRLRVCDTCPHRKEVDRLTGAMLKMIRNDPKNLQKCELCNCPLAALASGSAGNCKKGKWT